MKYLLTRESARAAGTLYTDSELAAMIPSEGATVEQLRLDADVPRGFRHWALCFAVGAPPRILREHACWEARRKMKEEQFSPHTAGSGPDPRSCTAVEVAERYARGEATDDELVAANVAADSAGRIGRPAAWPAYWASVENASDAASWAAGKSISIAAETLHDLALRLIAEEGK